jgi:phosphatidylglycerophosphate synthase
LRLSAVVVLPSMREAGPATALVVVGILLLDGIDGWVARRLGAASAFGAKFDMETDALLVAVLGVVLLAEKRLGAWALIPGSLRYVYAVAIRVTRARGEAPRSRFGRYVFAILVASFASSIWPVAPAHRFLSAAASALTVFSFARSAYWSFLDGRAKITVPSSS